MSAHVMGEESRVAAYFDLDGTLLNASSEKTLTGILAKRRPWRIPHATIAWTLGATFGLLTGKSPYDALRNRGHLSLASWRVLEQYSEEIATSILKPKISQGAWERLEWHRKQGHRLVLVTATVAPMAEAMARILNMDEVYGCGPESRDGWLSGSERGWSIPRRKGKVPIVERDAAKHGHDLSKCYGYGNTFADSWFMQICGHAIAVNPESSLEKYAKQHNWEIVHWPS